MIVDPIWILRGLMGVVLLVGSVIAFYGIQVGLRRRSRPMLYLGFGFLLVSLAAALSGIVYEVLTHDLLTAEIVSAAFDAAGFLVILYSLRMRTDAE